MGKKFSAQEYGDLWEYSPVGEILLDPVGHVVAANTAAEALLGRSKSDLLNRRFDTVVKTEDFETAMTLLEDALQSNSEKQCEARIIRPDGQVLICRMVFGGFRHLQDKQLVLAALIDVTSQKEKEYLLSAQEDRMRVALEGGRMGIWHFDIPTERIWWNARMYELLGRDPQRPPIDTETFFQYIHPDDIERVRRNLSTVLKSEDVFEDHFRVVRKGGKVIWLAASGHVFRDLSGRPLRLAGVNYDITEQMTLRDALRASRSELEERVRERTARMEKEIARREKYEMDLKASTEKILREHKRRVLLSKNLVDLLEQERRSIASALHDDVGQLLSIMNEEVRGALNELGADPGAATERLKGVSEMNRTAIGFVKDISRRLRPDILDHLGFELAIEHLIRQTSERSGLHIDHFIKGIPSTLSDEKELALYRIIQEALNNVVKHADAKNVFVSVIVRDNRIRATIEDDGRGFDLDASEGKREDFFEHLGIVIMQERAAQLNGEVTVDSSPGKGTDVVVDIPF